MIANKEKLPSFLQAKNLSEQDFANLLDVDISEVEKLLTGVPVGLDTARKFIRFFKAELAQHYIDWETMNIKIRYRRTRKMKNFEVQHTIRLYDPELIAAIGQAYDDHRKEFRNKNEFLTYLLRLGLKAMNSPPPKTPASGAIPPCAVEALTDEIKAVREIAAEVSKYLTTQFKKLYIHIAVVEKLLSATYNMTLGDLSGTPPIPEKVEDGFFDDLPMRFEKIILTLENRYGLR